MSSRQRHVLILHPGAMGHAVGACLVAAGHSVRWVSKGRSDATVQRAAAAGLSQCPDLASALVDTDIVMSICPPVAAPTVALEVAEAGFSGTYVDANAVSPDTVKDIGRTIVDAGGVMVDGGIIGPPPTESGLARLYLSGSEAEPISELFRGTALEAIAIGPAVGAASALKMAFAAWTKGTAALYLAIRALAQVEGVESALLAEWEKSIPELVGTRATSARRSVAKAWRFSGEMVEIADTFAAHGLPDGFHRAAADIYAALSAFKDEVVADLDEAVEQILRSE